MFRFLAARLIRLLAVLFGVSLLTFSVLHLIPGDPVRMLMGDMGGGAAGDQSDATYQSLKHELGLDRPIPAQYATYISNAIQGDLGNSFQRQRPVMDSIRGALPSTIQLTLVSMAITVFVGIVLGIIAALKHHTPVDSFMMVLSLFGLAVPSFWLGLILLMIFSFKLQWFPVRGTGWQSLVLPAVTLGLGGAGVIARLARASLLEVLQNEYITTARAKGLSETLVVIRHALSNSLIPVVTVAGLQFGQLLAGAFIVETVFARPGIGRLLVDAVLSRDYPMVQGVSLIAAVGYVLVNFAVDLSYGLLDPRVRHAN